MNIQIYEFQQQYYEYAIPTTWTQYCFVLKNQIVFEINFEDKIKINDVSCSYIQESKYWKRIA